MMTNGIKDFGNSLIVSLTLVGLATFASAQDGTFYAWLEAPETVVAGDTVTVTAWMTFESDVINMDEAYFGMIQTNIEATSGGSLLNSFSDTYGPFVGPASDGTPYENGIRNIFAWQPGEWLFNYNIDTSPVIAVFSFDITTQAGSFGELQLAFTGTTQRPESPFVLWYLDYDEQVTVDIDMPNIEAFFDPVTIRVVPAPGAAAVLVLAGVGAVRRRRR